MKDLFRFFVILCFCLAISCQSKPIDWGTTMQYFPTKDWLAEGIVNKYYIHYKKNDSYNTSTDIEYRSYLAGPNNQLFHNYYNPAFQQTVAKIFSFLTGKNFSNCTNQTLMNCALRLPF